MTRCLSVLLVAGLLGLLVRWSGADQPASKGNSTQGKKLIEWGWDEPDTKFMREHITEMERLPFDSLVFHATSSKGGSLAWDVWGGRTFTADDFRQAVEDLKATRFRRLTDRFLRVNVAPGKVDWFDDKAWACVVNNFGVAAHVAREGRCRGFLFDTEQYEGVTAFYYRKQKGMGKKTFTEYQAKVRQRGREWIRGVNRQFPDITILLTFGYANRTCNRTDPCFRASATHGNRDRGHLPHRLHFFGHDETSSRPGDASGDPRATASLIFPSMNDGKSVSKVCLLSFHAA